MQESLEVMTRGRLNIVGEQFSAQREERRRILGEVSNAEYGLRVLHAVRCQLGVETTVRRTEVGNARRCMCLR